MTSNCVVKLKESQHTQIPGNNSITITVIHTS